MYAMNVGYMMAEVPVTKVVLAGRKMRADERVVSFVDIAGL